MSTYKCSNCALTNWISSANCKRCKMPNPYLSTGNPINYQNQNFAQMAQGQPQNFASEPQVYPQTTIETSSPSTAIEINSPPQPNYLYGNQFGQASASSRGRFQPIPYDPHPTLTETDKRELETAIKQIRVGTIAGGVLTGICAVLSLLLRYASTIRTDQLTSLDHKGTEMKAMIESSLGLVFAFTMVYLLLTIGIYCKSRVCSLAFLVTIVVGLFIELKMLTNGIQIELLGQIVLDLLLIGLFLAATIGCFKYHDISDRNPSAVL